MFTGRIMLNLASYIRFTLCKSGSTEKNFILFPKLKIIEFIFRMKTLLHETIVWTHTFCDKRHRICVQHFLSHVLLFMITYWLFWYFCFIRIELIYKLIFNDYNIYHYIIYITLLFFNILYLKSYFLKTFNVIVSHGKYYHQDKYILQQNSHYAYAIRVIFALKIFKLL